MLFRDKTGSQEGTEQQKETGRCHDGQGEKSRTHRSALGGMWQHSTVAITWDLKIIESRWWGKMARRRDGIPSQGQGEQDSGYHREFLMVLVSGKGKARARGGALM